MHSTELVTHFLILSHEQERALNSSSGEIDELPSTSRKAECGVVTGKGYQNVDEPTLIVLLSRRCGLAPARIVKEREYSVAAASS